MLPYRVFVTDGRPITPSHQLNLFDGLAHVDACEAESEDQLLQHEGLAEADAVLVYHTMRITEKTISKLKKCRVLVRCGVGYDNVDHACAREYGIPVANVPDYGTDEVADTAIGLMLAMTRGINRLNTRLRDATPPWAFTAAAPLHRLRGRQLSIVGLGRIGTAVALRARALGMQVAFFDPYKPDGYDKALSLHRVETLEELLDTSAVLTLHCPLTYETERLIQNKTLARLPAGAYLVNTARGGLVDTGAVAAAIASGHLAGAALDVLAQEPPPDDDPLLVAWRDPSHPAYERVILNAHTAFYSEEGLLEMHRKGAETCRRALLGLPLRNVVNGVVR